jgi:hypothetical protein
MLSGSKKMSSGRRQQKQTINILNAEGDKLLHPTTTFAPVSKMDARASPSHSYGPVAAADLCDFDCFEL